MPVRSALSSLLSRAVERRVRSWIEASAAPAEARLAALEQENEKLKKKLSMTTGAVQAATAELVRLKAAAEESGNLASQAMQRATSALAAAESAAEGVAALEAGLSATADEQPGEVRIAAPATCQVPGCEEPRRAKGYCAKHYQQWKRGNLELG